MQCMNHAGWTSDLCCSASPNTTPAENTACDAAAKLQYNGCLFAKSNHTLLLIQPYTFSSVHPRGTIHCVSDVEYLPLPAFLLQLPTTLSLLHADKSAVASCLQKTC